MTHPFLIDQTAYLPRREPLATNTTTYKHTSRKSTSSSSSISSSSGSSSRSFSPSIPKHTYGVSEPRQHIYQSNSSSDYFATASARSSQTSLDSRTNQRETEVKEIKTQEQLEKEKKRERRKGVIFTAF
jgi:hypothetical protein